jgi:hypothetical protein
MAQIRPEEPYIRESERLMAMPEPQRNAYVNQVILNLAQAINKIAQTPGLLRKKGMVEKLVNEWTLKSPKILPALIYSIQPQFRQAYLELLDAIAKLKPQQ